MIRALLVVLVVLVAILAVVLDRTWLYVVSGASVAAAVAWFATQAWRTHRRRKQGDAREASRREHRLQDFGIVSIRPQDKQHPSSSSSPSGSSDSPSSDSPSSSSPPSEASPVAESSASKASGSGVATYEESSPSDNALDSPSVLDERSEAGGDTEGATRQDGANATPSVSARKREEKTTTVRDDASPEPNTDEADPASSSVAGLTTSPRSDEPVLVPLVESLRAAVDAHSACLLVQEDVVLEYKIKAIVSQSADVQRKGLFSTADPLLTASMSRQPISVRRIEGGRDVVAGYLRYYTDPPNIDHIALAPVPVRDTPKTIFLLVDATSRSDLGAPHARALIEQYAETVALVLQSGAAGSASSAPEASTAVDSQNSGGGPSQTGTPRVRESDPVVDMDGAYDDDSDDGDHHPSPENESEERATKAGSGASEEFDSDTEEERDGQHENHESDHEEEQKPRPRREIIAEEMEQADREATDLALVLVHLNRSESIARAGEAAVASAEDALRDRLRRAAPEQRVERFGELTYGVFFRGGLSQVEPWAINVQNQMHAATGELEGGASIGVALRGPRHDTPESLRADATQALHEAYKTGTCTIIE